MIRFSVLSLSVLLLSACSTVIDKSQQEVTVETPGAHEALCTLENRDLKYKIRAPKTLTITKSKKPFKLRCLAAGNRVKEVVVEPTINENSLRMNVANAGIGALVDYETAAMYQFPDTVVVDFTDIPATPMPLPAYQKFLNENPSVMGMEEFRPGRSALQRDRYEQTPTLQRIDREGELIERTSEMTEVTGGSFTVQGGEETPAANDSEGLTHSMNPQVFDVQRDSQGYEIPATITPPYGE
ncbi:MAG: hypothetical protein H6868_06430 [Rhodospirillales bacterium]|nr:hypothetical protein [Rhodospirillales bacterium]